MTRPLSRVSLRGELASAIALVTLFGVGATFLALYSGTGSRLRGQLDTQLRTQAAEWHQATARTDLSTPAGVERAAKSFIAAQRYHAEALIIAVQPTGGRNAFQQRRGCGP